MGVISERRHLAFGGAKYIWYRYTQSGSTLTYVDTVYSNTADYPYDGLLFADGYYYKMVKGIVQMHRWEKWEAVLDYAYEHYSQPWSNDSYVTINPTDTVYYSSGHYGGENGALFYPETGLFEMINPHSMTGSDFILSNLYGHYWKLGASGGNSLYFHVEDMIDSVVHDGDVWKVRPESTYYSQQDMDQPFFRRGTHFYGYVESTENTAYPDDHASPEDDCWYHYYGSYMLHFDRRQEVTV